jgi:hypothetical protein
MRIEDEGFHRGGALSTTDETVTLSHSICPTCVEAQLPPKDGRHVHGEPNRSGSLSAEVRRASITR